jgi:hypothetical protein
MSMTGEELIDEVRALVGREGAGDMGVITDTRVTRWLNEAQYKIAEECIGLDHLQFDSTTLALITDDVTYAIGDITFADDTSIPVLDVFDLYHLDGANSIKLAYVPIDEFDFDLIDPTSSEYSGERPTRWTRRGENIEIKPRPSSDYNGDTLKATGQRYPREFTLNDASYSDLTNADKGMIYYAVAEAWGGIGDEVKRQLWKKRFTNPHPTPQDDYGWLEDYKDKYSRMDSWSGNVFFSGEE